MKLICQMIEEYKDKGFKTIKTSMSDLIQNVLFRILMGIMILCLLHYGRRIFIAERFGIPSESMAPTLVPGDRVWVNKLLFGARIYKSFDFEDHAPLNCFRVPGIRDIRPGDVICFNYPHGCGDESKIEFKINNVFCKRVLGCPGDRVGAVDGHCWNDKQLRPIGVLRAQENARWMYDSIFVWNNCYYVLSQLDRGWNLKNWGPLIVPAKGMSIRIDDTSRTIYKQLIEYEIGGDIDSNMIEYTFRENYYFAVGDNTMSSYDSRYWGFIPEDFIIGIVGGRKVRNNPNQSGI